MKHTPIAFTRTLFLGGLLVLAFGYACQKKKENTLAVHDQPARSATHPVFNRAVGQPIAGTLGRKWISNLQRQSKTSVPSFILDASRFHPFLQDSNCAGISLYYTQDAAGQIHLALVGVDLTGTVMKNDTVATEAGIVNWATFLQWRSNYKNNHPGAALAHFFGLNTYKRLIEQQGVEKVRAIKALNDASKPQLLLSDAEETNVLEFEDASIVCPPNCPKELEEMK